MPGAQLPLILLDRDGVINRDSTDYIKSAAEWQALPGSLEAIAELSRAGFQLAVVTNQSGIGRGLFSEATLNEIHSGMVSAIESAGGELAGIYYCPHTPDDACSCRKPKPGLLLRAVAELSGGNKVDPVAVFVGDKLSDVEAAIAASVEPIFIDAGATPRVPAGISSFPDLAAAAASLINRFASKR